MAISALVHLGDVHIEEIPLAEGLLAELAEVQVGAGEVDVLHVLFCAAGVAEALLADVAGMPGRRPQLDGFK